MKSPGFLSSAQKRTDPEETVPTFSTTQRMNVEEIGLGMSEEQLEEKEERLIWRTERKGDGFAVPR